MQFLYVVSQLLLLAVLSTLLMGRFVKETGKLRIVVVVIIVLDFFIPLNGLSIAQWLRTLLGDLSVLTLLLLSNILAQRLFNISLLNPQSRKILLWGIAGLGTLFYPLALGFGPFDPYQSGYAPVWMAAVLALISLLCWFGGRRELAVIVIVPLLAFNLNLLESTNLWDYLLDPVLWMYAVVQSVTGAGFYRLKKVSD
jgi:hypothetical protein